MLPNFSLIQADGTSYNLHDFKDKVLLIVNIATGCGFSDQIKELEVLYQTYGMHDFMILAFPSNQFHQEPLTNQEILKHCQLSINTSYLIHQKIYVNGKDQHPLYRWLKSQKSGWFNSEIKWNFTKFLIDRQGKVVKRYGPTTSPCAIAKDIEWFL